jgi:hypothetical protein
MRHDVAMMVVQLVCRLGQGLLIAVDEKQIDMPPGQLESNGPADARRRSSDQGRLAWDK